MNEILKNTHFFVEVLRMARCSAVQQWDEAAFQKAYKWANYFEEVYRRVQAKPSLVEKLNEYLDNFNKSGQIYLGKLKLSFEVLGKSRALLRQFLLQNPHLSGSQYQLTLKLYEVTVGDTQDCSRNGDLLTDATHLSQTKAAFELLCKMRDRLTEDTRLFQDKTPKARSKSLEFLTAVDSEEVCVDVSANCLLKNVDHQLNFGDPCNQKMLLFEKLQVLAQQENGLRIIITALLSTPDGCQYAGQRSYHVNQFILDWLFEFLSCTKPHPRLLSIPPHLLSKMSFMYDAFFKLYLSHLVSWADKMAPSICTSEKDCHTFRGIQWRFNGVSHDKRATDHHHLSFPFFSFLVNHFSQLVTGPDFIADTTKKEMRSRLAERSNLTATNVGNDSTRFNMLELNIWEDICELMPL